MFKKVIDKLEDIIFDIECAVEPMYELVGRFILVALELLVVLAVVALIVIFIVDIFTGIF